MSKILLLIITLFSTVTIFSQWDIDAPSITEAKNKLLKESKLKSEIENEMGLPFDQLELKSDGWSGYKKSGFSLTYNQCGRKMYPNWPQDGAFTKFVINGPKDKDGVYKSMGVYADYSRSAYNGEECFLYSEWTYRGYRIEKAQEYGYKEFTKEESQKLLLDYLKTGEASVLNDFIEITDIDFENYNQSSTSAGIHHLNFYFKGTEVQYTDDRTTIIGMNESARLRMSLQVEKKDGSWKGTKLGLFTAGMYSYDQSYNYKKTTEMYETYYSNYKSDGWEAIYLKRTEKEKPNGELENLQTRINEYMNILIESGNELSADNILSYVAPSKRQEVTTWFDENFTNKNERKILKSFQYKDALPFKYYHDNKLEKIAFPELTAQFVLLKKPKKKWIEQDQCSNCKKSSTSSGSTTYHSMIWVWEDNQWFIYNPASLFVENDDRIDLRY